MLRTEDIELERTFLAKEIPKEIANSTPESMKDIYIPINAKHPQIRIRSRGDKMEITKKVPLVDGDASEQIERTIPLSEAEYIALSQIDGKVVEKDRYKAEINGFPAEVDVFKGDLKGLVLIDFEFQSREEMEQFAMPSCALADITQASFVAGGLLAGKSIDDILPQLQEYKYKLL